VYAHTFAETGPIAGAAHYSFSNQMDGKRDAVSVGGPKGCNKILGADDRREKSKVTDGKSIP
jgi:hypothetical protein